MPWGVKHMVKINQKPLLNTINLQKGVIKGVKSAPEFTPSWCCKSHYLDATTDEDNGVKRTIVMSTHKKDELPTKSNGISNGFGAKTPFLIGVAGGTASGKVSR